MISDDVKIRKLLANGSYTKVQNINNINAQEKLINIAKKHEIESKEKELVKKVVRKRENASKIKSENKEINSEGKKNFLQKLLDFFKK